MTTLRPEHHLLQELIRCPSVTPAEGGALDLLEGKLKTPVQAAVKREDEQEFARLNGQNLMFCEDSGRKIKGALLADDRVEDFWVRINHFESLHGHDAVAVVTAGIPDGYAPIP